MSEAGIAGRDGRALSELTRDELLALVEAPQPGIRIQFPGKDVARQLARCVRPRVSRAIAKYSVGDPEEQARNLVIEGDNLQALVSLYQHRGQVDLLLTDPPYNTGNDWRYNDRWDTDPNDPGLGDWVGPDDIGRHTKWMKFMYPRLQMMRAMLKPTGVLAICIDHRELFRLGQMLDELFGERNRLGIINWQKSYAPRNDNKHVSTATEYVLVYSKDLDLAKTGLLDRTESMDSRYKGQDDDPRPWASDNPTAGSAATHAGMVYAIQSPFTGQLYYPPEGRCWGNEKKFMRQWLQEWGSPYVEKDLKDSKAKALVLKGARIYWVDGVPTPDPADPVVKRARQQAEAVHKTRLWPHLYFTDGGEGGPRLKRYLDAI